MFINHGEQNMPHLNDQTVNRCLVPVSHRPSIPVRRWMLGDNSHLMLVHHWPSNGEPQMKNSSVFALSLILELQTAKDP
jgi:hypothetical protein